MAINSIDTPHRSFFGRLFDRITGHTSAPAAPSASPATAAPAAPKLNSGSTPLIYVDGCEITPRTAAAATPAAAAPAAKPGERGAAIGRAFGTAAKVGGSVGGVGLVIWGGVKVLGAMAAATVSFPAFATGVGIAIGGVALFKFGAWLNKAIVGE